VVERHTVQGRHAVLAACDLLPDTHLVDAGYVSVAQILSAPTTLASN
jgi:hypothetical protein